jgi:hypothetical protein
VNAAILLLLTAAAAPAGDRSRAVAGWTVSDRSEEDGGRLVTMARQGPGWRLEHRFGLWHGNGGVYVGAMFEWRGCRSGEADHLFPWDEPLSAEQLAGRTRDYLDECNLSTAQQRQVLAGQPEANALAQHWVADFRRALEDGEP